MRIVLPALVIALGCYASHELGLEGEHDARFAHDWVVTSAFGWALLATETVYRFHDDGEIEIVRHREGSYFEGQAGKWFDYSDTTEETPVCSFGDRWWSTGEELHIESECTDGMTRVLDLVEGGGANAGSVELYVVGPSGAIGYWVHDAIPGAFRRCTDDC